MEGVGLNDAGWANPQARAAGLRALALAQLGTAEWSTEQTVVFARALAEGTIRRVLPITLRSAGLEAEAVRCEQEGTTEAAANAARAAHVAVRAVAYAANADAADAAAANAAADAADAAAANAAAYAYVAVRAGAVLHVAAQVAVDAIAAARMHP